MLRRVLASPRNSIYGKALEPAAMPAAAAEGAQQIA